MKNLEIKLLGIIVITVLLLQTSVVFATSTNDLKNEKSEVNSQIKEKKEELEDVKQEKSKTISEVENLTNQITNYESQIQNLDSKINDLNNKITESQSQLEQKQKDYEKNKKLAEERLVVMQESGETSTLDLILSSANIIDAISSYYFISEIANADMKLLDTIEQEQKEIKEAKASLENSKRELDTSKAEKQGVSTQLKTAKAEKDKQVAQLSQEEKDLQSRIDELNQTNKDIDAKIKAAEEAIKKAQEEANKNNGGHNNSGNNGGHSGSSSSGFIYPVPSKYSKVTTGINYSNGQYHGAVDFGSAGINGQPIYAVADGYVVTSENLGNRSYGNYILIAHYNGLYTLYAHGQDGSRTVSTGQTVKQGQQIMRVGNTGNSTGPHLHFEVRTSPGTYANRKNPMNYLP